MPLIREVYGPGDGGALETLTSATLTGAAHIDVTYIDACYGQ